MTEESSPNFSRKTLAGFFHEALEARVDDTSPEIPVWVQGDEFPFTVQRFVGRGGSGSVWRTVRKADQETIALKLISFGGDRRKRLRWENECETLSRVNHAHLVRLVDFGLAPDLDAGWVALEWIDGPDLATLLADRGSLPLAEVVEFLPPIVAALNSLHEAQLVHRDIKPGNLLFEKAEGRWVLADFGLAYDLAQDEEARVTRTLESPATPGYAAPERDQPGALSSPLGDQYSLAFTIWEMLAGTRPQGAFSKLHRLVRVPKGIDPVLRKALSTDPSRRFSDLGKFEKDFLRAVKRPPWLRPLLVVLALVMGGIFLYAGLQKAFAPPPFPREFKSGPLRVTEGREHFMEVDLTLKESGEFEAIIRTHSGENLYGFTGKVELIWRDKNGGILKSQRSNPLGVNGRLIIGASHERVDHWRDRLPAEMAAKVERIDFRAVPGGVSQEAREDANRNRINKDLRKIREGAGKAWESFMRTLREKEK